MNKVVIPATGIQIQHDRTELKTPPQIIRLNFTESITKDLIRALKGDAQAQVKLGKRPAITFGTRNVSLNHGTDKFPFEMYSGTIDGSQPIQFAGRLSHTLESQHAKDVTARVDKALANLKRTLNASMEDRTNGGSGLMGNKLVPSSHRPSALSGAFLTSRPSSPFLGSLSPRPGPTSAPLQTATSTKERIRLDAIKTPLIHLLAVEPYSAEDLARKLRVKRSECDKVLEKIARDSRGGKKELKDKAYRDLDVWKFKYESQNDRQLAIEHAVSAYDRMRVEKTDQLWQMLLAKEDRGKSIYLSKLNFDKPLATGNLTPKIPERSTDGSIEGKSTSSDQTSKKSNATNAKLTDDLPKTKTSAGANAKTAAMKETAKVGILSKDGNKPKPAKQESKYKSSEKIEDSDEEANATKTLPVPKQPTQKKQPVVGRSTKGEKSLPSTSKAPLHKSQLSVSSVGGSDVDQGRLTPSTAAARKRPAAEAAEGKERGAPRARNGSSPVKPSPLGSSPPTNSRDIDSTSNSSISTSQSSAPSSPPSSNELSLLKKDYSPVVTDKRNDQLTNGVKKRKADTDHDQPPAKRQTLHNNASISHDRAHGASKVNGETAKDLKRGSPDSDQFSASDKPITRQGVESEARQFKKYWDRYKELHDRLEKLSEAHRDPDDVEKLWKMHKRLKEMKEQIWKDWEKVEKLESR